MNIIATGIIKKTNTSFSSLKTNLGANVIGNALNLDARLDALELSLNETSVDTNDRIKSDAINLIKLHDRLNAVLLQTKFQKNNLYFDDFVDEAGTSSDTTMTFDSSTKAYHNHTQSVAVWKSNVIVSAVVPNYFVLVINGADFQGITCQISRNNGTDFYDIVPETMFTLPSSATQASNIIIKINNIPANASMTSVGLIWSN